MRNSFSINPLEAIGDANASSILKGFGYQFELQNKSKHTASLIEFLHIHCHIFSLATHGGSGGSTSSESASTQPAIWQPTGGWLKWAGGQLHSVQPSLSKPGIRETWTAALFFVIIGGGEANVLFFLKDICILYPTNHLSYLLMTSVFKRPGRI